MNKESRLSNDAYLRNPLIHRDRRLGNHPSAWVRQFDCTTLKPLIICRGPIRKEAMDVFTEMGIVNYGILLSERDSIVYRNALAPELRALTDPRRVHRVPDYTGSNKEERDNRIRQIIGIAAAHGYNAIFAGYGFMAEDEAMVAAMERAGLNFIGPCSRTVREAGLKDEAKRTALRVGVSVTPGIDNATSLTLLKKYPDVAALETLCREQDLKIDPAVLSDTSLALSDRADRVLAAAYAQGLDLYSVEELGATIEEGVREMYARYPNNRVRLKAIGGGGGKGQRILAAPSSYQGSTEERVRTAAAKAPGLVREILNEVKATGIGDNKNVLIELNIETTRHQEIQVVGNGEWAITLGGRDCSLQMHEQKLLEVSVTDESLRQAISVALHAGKTDELASLERDLRILGEMEEEATRFGVAVGLDSVSTFECIVDGDSHFFMEMNTRIQVEHRVTELCYALRFTNPDNADDYFDAESLVEVMVLLAAHGSALPLPQRMPRFRDSVEARLNATDQALRPSAGGVIEYWSDAVDGEIRDDQGISLHNPDTGVFMKYTLAGAYDSNIALLLTVSDSREAAYRRLTEIIRRTRMYGKDLATNLEFHYGLLHWFLARNVNARPTTRFIVPYLTAVGQLREQALDVDLEQVYSELTRDRVQTLDAEAARALRECLDAKHTLILRPLQQLLARPHLLSGWLSKQRGNYTVEQGSVLWRVNPLSVLRDTYRFLNMDGTADAEAARVIWAHDDELLSTGEAFYRALEQHLVGQDWPAMQRSLQTQRPPQGVDDAVWAECQAAHRGFQAGLELFSILPLLAESTGFFALDVNADLTIAIPDVLHDPELQGRMGKILVPPPAAGANEILAESGGMFYGRESPSHPPFVQPGDSFRVGDPLFIIEVMKMFNKVYAPCAGTVEAVMIEADGVIVSKGQTILQIVPEQSDVGETAEAQVVRRHIATRTLVAALCKTT